MTSSGKSDPATADIPALAVPTGGFSEAELLDAGAARVFESIGALRMDREAILTPPS
jgi:hypothetical protein